MNIQKEMFGTNPKTGKPIRILKSEATINRDQKTVCRLGLTPPPRADRCDTLCVGLDELMVAQKKGIRADAVILLEGSPAEVEFVRRKEIHQSMILFMTRKIALLIGEKEFMAMRMSNVICLEEIHQVFPFTGMEIPWDETEQDAVFLSALILRATNIIGLAESEVNQDRLKAVRAQGIQVSLFKEKEIPQLWFLTQYYKPEKARREREIKKCLEMNVDCPYIDKIVLLNEKDFSASFPSDPKSKLQQVVVGKRLTYAMVLQWFKENAPPNTICVFANSDIYLDPTWRLLWSIQLQDKFLSLLRYDVQDNGSPSVLFGPRADSQDTWCFLSDSLRSRTFDWKDLDFPFGKAGCDNAINVEMLRKKFLIVNPAVSIKTHHLHTSAIRNYDPADIVDKPMYFYVEPTGIHDMKPITDLKPMTEKQIDHAPFSRKLTGVSDRAVDTYCTMVEKQELFKYERRGENLYPKTTSAILKHKNVFHTAQGLVYDTSRIYVGPHEVSQKAWSEAKISPLVPSFHAKQTLCVQLPQDYMRNAEMFLLFYVSRILALKKEVGFAEFWAPRGERIMDSLQIFNWGSSREVPVLPIAPNAQVWTETTYELSNPTPNYITKEDITTLREALFSEWMATPKDQEKKRYVIVVNEFLDADWVNQLEASRADLEIQCIFSGRTSPERMVERLRGAHGVIFYGGPKSEDRWGWNWVLPKGARVIEIQNEMDPDGYAAHMSGACELQHTILTIPRGKAEFMKQESLRLVRAALDQVTKPVADTSSLPLIYMPRKSLTGFFGHPGDSFRELVQLWAERGYVRLAEHPTAVQIWMKDVGDTLLYDRPTLEWLQSSPPQEQVWKQALFGNPAPSGGNSQSWIFWARRPRFVEEVVASGKPETGFTNRSQRLVFYGKIENRVQERRRTNVDWESACSEFVCPKGDEKPYVFTQKEYLERLTDAKFGLCLAGFGKKCHREVECMAMGTVPIVAPDVDLQNYADPPIEGIHYLTAKTPEEAKQLSESITEARWNLMSAAARQWWKKNCSVEGSWTLTKSLLSE
jgi:hypothetical protein